MRQNCARCHDKLGIDSPRLHYICSLLFVLAAFRYVGANLALNSDWMSSTLESARSKVNLNRRAMAIRLSLVVNPDSGIHRPTGWLLGFDGSRVAITDSDSTQHPRSRSEMRIGVYESRTPRRAMCCHERDVQRPWRTTTYPALQNGQTLCRL